MAHDGVPSMVDDEDFGPIVKAYTMDGSAPLADTSPAPTPQAHASEVELQQFFTSVGALQPPYDLLGLLRIYEKSSALRPCVEAYKTNIDGFGYHLEPVIDLDASNSEELLSDIMADAKEAAGSYEPVTPSEVAALREIIKRAMRREKGELDRFFSYCCAETSFVELRKENRQDVESTGNGFWEVLRNSYGRIVGFSRITVRTMRLRPIEWNYHDVKTPQKTNLFEYVDVDVKRRFRTYVQAVFGVPVVYFKEFGDTRIMSSKTGVFYPTIEELKDAEPRSAAATELIHWKVYSGLGPYGVPRWIGATLAVTGLRSSEEVNARYFHNKGIPPMAILVSGGKLAKGAAEAIRAHLREKIIGLENFWNVLIVEATGDVAGSVDSTSRVRIELKPLLGDQPQDALFQKYEANCDAKVARQYRLPELIRGASAEVNRAQAEAVLKFVEQQVFQPEREEFDWVMNSRVLADMRIRFWRFVTNSAPMKDATLETETAEKLVTAGILTPNEGRALTGEALNKDFAPTKAAWGDQPLQLTVAGLIPGDAPAPQGPEEQHAEAKRIAFALDSLGKALERGDMAAIQKALPQTRTIVVDKAVIDSWFEAA